MGSGRAKNESLQKLGGLEAAHYLPSRWACGADSQVHGSSQKSPSQRADAKFPPNISHPYSMGIWELPPTPYLHSTPRIWKSYADREILGVKVIWKYMEQYLAVSHDNCPQRLVRYCNTCNLKPCWIPPMAGRVLARYGYWSKKVQVFTDRERAHKYLYLYRTKYLLPASVLNKGLEKN